MHERLHCRRRQLRMLAKTGGQELRRDTVHPLTKQFDCLPNEQAVLTSKNKDTLTRGILVVLFGIINVSPNAQVQVRSGSGLCLHETKLILTKSS